MRPYLHTVQYYETDRMGITHHSNYIRWMEEARVDLLSQLGWPLEKLEAMTAVCSVGLDMIVIPGDTPASTISARCERSSAVRFFSVPAHRRYGSLSVRAIR